MSHKHGSLQPQPDLRVYEHLHSEQQAVGIFEDKKITD